MTRLAVVIALLATLAVAAPARARFGDAPTAMVSVTLDRLDRPAGVSASGAQTTTATITWQPIGDTYGEGYRLYRSTTSGSGYALVTAVNPISASSVTDKPLLPGMYYYVVRAYAGQWLSEPSSEVAILLL